MVNYNKTPLSIQEIHKEVLTVLQTLITICDNQNIKYFLAYGSLIGAVRHKGFIPWDDDVDIIMLRNDYDKFLNYCEEHRHELAPYKLMNRENTKGYPYSISRFCDTRFQMVMDNKCDVNMGLFVDIYPFDGVKLGKEKIIQRRKSLFTKLVSLKFEKKFEKSKRSFFYTIPRLFLFCFAKIVSLDWILNNLYRLKHYYSSNDSPYVSCIIWDLKLNLFNKEWFDHTVELPFENLLVKVPAEYDKVLQKSYGDYMQLPPEHERRASHGYSLYRS